MNRDYDDAVDEIIEALSTLLEFVGIIPGNGSANGNANASGNGFGNDGSEGDPWVRLSNSVRDLILSLGKLDQLVPADAVNGTDTDTNTNTNTNTNTTTENDSTARVAETNELLMNMEHTIHQIRGNTESVSAMLAKGITAQLTSCRALESIASSDIAATLPTLLLPMAKALASAIRRQKAVWLQSLDTIEDCFARLYTTTGQHGETIDNLQRVYRRVNRRCIDPDSSPWKEAASLMNYIASTPEPGTGTKNSTKATTTTTTTTATTITSQTDCRDAMIVPSHPPTGKSPAIAPVFRHFSGSDCASSQLQSIANVFFHGQQQYDNNNNNNEEEESTTALSILVVGPEGSGKTHLLDSIEQQCRFAGVDIDIIHPVLPFDAIGTTAGAAEDILISMICYAKTHEKNCLLLLDDIDSICGQTEHSTSATANGIVSSGGQREPHLTARLRNLFLSLLDMIQKRDYYYESRNGGRMMLICSSRENFGRHIDRFDRILPLLPPNEEERRRILSDYDARGAGEGGDGGGDSGGGGGDGDGDDGDGDGGDSSSSIDNLVDCTLGFSRAEIAHHCRQALSALLHSRLRWTDAERGTGPGTNNSHDYDYDYDYNFASYLREKLQSSTPESLKNGANADFVDMKVFSARDLQKLHPIRNPENPVDDLPLFGESARTAWQELRRLIVLPVCRGSALDNILYHRGGNGSNNNNNNKTFAGGVLLAASPGTGKSTLAYFGAAVAASINPSIKLIDVGCTSLIHKEVGGSEKALHRLFRSARSATPCIVVMDGIENIAAVRGNDTTTEGTMDRVLSTLLTELDGAESESNNHGGGGGSGGGGMAVIGITHNPEWIDPALRRPGRLERTIWLDNPDREGRKSIVAKEFGTAVYQPDDVHPELRTLDDLAARVANETEGCTGAEVIAICNESKLSAFNRFFQDKSSSNNSNNEKSDCITPQVVLEAVGTRRSNSGQ